MATQFITPGDKPSDTMASVLRAQWERYKNAFTPVEDELVDSLNVNMAPEAAREANQAARRGQEATQRIQRRFGIADVDPNLSARIRRFDRSLAGTSAFNQTALAQVDRRDNVRQGLVETGQALLNQATGGLASATGLQSSRENANRAAMAQYRQQQQQASAQRTQTTTGLIGAGIIAAASFF